MLKSKFFVFATTIAVVGSSCLVACGKQSTSDIDTVSETGLHEKVDDAPVYTDDDGEEEELYYVEYEYDDPKGESWGAEGTTEDSKYDVFYVEVPGGASKYSKNPDGTVQFNRWSDILLKDTSSGDLDSFMGDIKKDDDGTCILVDDATGREIRYKVFDTDLASGIITMDIDGIGKAKLKFFTDSDEVYSDMSYATGNIN